ncbi:hypothetical protein SMD11_0011 [Streptomyces albireticuli]|uniref:Uncharacterized protein n=1 Tax=Streptomyces albireticuli TaxID=1940 RepID=A0A1Z2KUI2_9ACTN|nr:hypothetical protein SMD11_0011 [Streptomyces albireticuli]
MPHRRDGFLVIAAAVLLTSFPVVIWYRKPAFE